MLLMSDLDVLEEDFPEWTCSYTALVLNSLKQQAPVDVIFISTEILLKIKKFAHTSQMTNGDVMAPSLPAAEDVPRPTFL